METRVLLDSLDGAYGQRYDFAPLAPQYFPGLDKDDLVRFALNGYFKTIAETEDYAKLYSSVVLVLSPYALHCLVQAHISGAMDSDVAQVEQIFNSDRYRLECIEDVHYLTEPI